MSGKDDVRDIHVVATYTKMSNSKQVHFHVVRHKREVAMRALETTTPLAT